MDGRYCSLNGFINSARKRVELAPTSYPNLAVFSSSSPDHLVQDCSGWAIYGT